MIPGGSSDPLGGSHVTNRWGVCTAWGAGQSDQTPSQEGQRGLARFHHATASGANLSLMNC